MPLNQSQLCKALRRRQLAAGLQPKSVIRAASDEVILDSYRRCCHCQGRLLDWPQRFDSVAAFIAAVNAALKTHLCNRG